MERAGGARAYRPRVRARTALEGTILKPGAKPGATRTSVDALGADEHGVAEQQLRLLGWNNALRGGGRHAELTVMQVVHRRVPDSGALEASTALTTIDASSAPLSGTRR